MLRRIVQFSQSLLLAALLGGCVLLPPPNLAIAIEPASGYSPLQVRLEAQADSGSGAFAIAWEFGDGGVAEGAVVERVFTGKGDVSIRAVATGQDGRQVTAEGIVRLLNRLPTARFTVQPSTPSVGLEVHFDSTFSYDPDGEIVSFLWDFGDGETAIGAKASHAFQEPQCGYRVTLTVTDDTGDTNQTYRDIEPFGCDH